MSDERKTFDLKSPVKDVDGTELSQLALRKPKAKDLRVFDKVKGEIAGTYELISKLAGIPVSQVDEMDIDDVGQVMAWVADFLPAQLADRAGETD